MRHKFFGYYRPTEQEFETLWRDAVIVFDTNIMLHIFRYSRNTSSRFMQIMNELKGRIWLPFLVGQEFHRQWRDIVDEHNCRLVVTSEKIEKEGEVLKSLYNEVRRFNLMDVPAEQEKISKFIEELVQTIKTQVENTKYDDADTRLLAVSEIIGENIGECLSEDLLKEIHAEGELRYAAKIPPGFDDIKKGMPDRYNDLVIWKETIKYCKKKNVPLIFVTDDNKNDWWIRKDGEKVAPRAELLQEFYEAVGKSSYIYSFFSFLERSSKFLGQTIEPSVISEVSNSDAMRQTLSQSQPSEDEMEFLRKDTSWLAEKYTTAKQEADRLRLAVEKMDEQLSDNPNVTMHYSRMKAKLNKSIDALEQGAEINRRLLNENLARIGVLKGFVSD